MEILKASNGFQATEKASNGSGSWWTGRYPGWQGEKGESLEDLEEIHNLRSLLGFNPEGPSAWERDKTEGYINFQCLPEGHERGTVAPRKPLSPQGPPIYYRIVDAGSLLVRETLRYNGLIPTDGDNWALQWSGGAKDAMPKRLLRDNQKVNHFPGSAELCRKDKLWSNFALMRKLCGRHAYDFVPESFVLPAQLDEFIEFHSRTKYTWIVKPRAGGQGNGIFLVTDPSDLPPKGQYVVSRYIDNPMLIQGLKFDLRIYVLVTSFKPLRVYVYREGLCRFATKAYSMKEEHLHDIYRHLTNYSQNKYASNFVENRHASKDNVGHKWSLSALNRHLKHVGVNVEEMWSRIFDVIMKSLLAVQRPVHAGGASSFGLQPALENCFELFGFDVMMDAENKPWLLEVNHSPSMHAESPLDWRIKSSVLADALNVVGLNQTSWPWQRVRSSMGSLRQNAQMGRSLSSPSFCRTPGDADAVGPLLMDAAFFLAGPNGEKARALPEPHRRAFEKVLSEAQRCRNFVRLAPSKATYRRYGRMAQRSFRGTLGSPEESSLPLNRSFYGGSGDPECMSPIDPSNEDNAEDGADRPDTTQSRLRTPPGPDTRPVELPPIMKNTYQPYQNLRPKILQTPENGSRYDPGLPFSKGSGRPDDSSLRIGGPMKTTGYDKKAPPPNRPWDHLAVGELGKNMSLSQLYIPQQVEILL